MKVYVVIYSYSIDGVFKNYADAFKCATEIIDGEGYIRQDFEDDEEYTAVRQQAIEDIIETYELM